MWLVQFFKVPVFAENCGCGRRYVYLVSISLVLKITKAFCKLKPCGLVAFIFMQLQISLIIICSA